MSSITSEVNDALSARAQRDKANGIKVMFEANSDRVADLSFDLGEFYIDFSKTHLSAELLDIYAQFATDCKLEQMRSALFAGDKINNSEQRAVLHTLLRSALDPDQTTVDEDLLAQAKQAREAFRQQYQALQQTLSDRATPVTDIIHVGIGGSSLGTQVLFESLVDKDEQRRIHFVGNIDAHKLVAVLAQCQVESTMVIGVSKTFSTAETLQNLDSIGNWFSASGVKDHLKQFVAVTANPDAALAYGIEPENIVGFPVWVGGRYSVWSSVSLSAAIVLGYQAFEQFLDGAAAIDQHFLQAKPEQNICFVAAALDHYYQNYMGSSSRAIFAYDHRMRSLVDYLQQLETESNGKDRQRDGAPVDQKTSAVVWGGVGTDVQHSVFQMLHQGTSLTPAEFILVRQPDHNLEHHHRELLANGIAQTAALLAGQDRETVERLHADQELSDIALGAKIFSGERPSTTILLEQLTPRSLGALLAFYEHRTFCGGVLTNINSFDQMGVELGKRLAKAVKPLLEGLHDNGDIVSDDFDASTAALIRRVNSGR